MGLYPQTRRKRQPAFCRVALSLESGEILPYCQLIPAFLGLSFPILPNLLHTVICLFPADKRFAELYSFVVCYRTYFQLHTFSPTSIPREDRLQGGPLSETHTVYSLINSSPDQVPQRKETCKKKDFLLFPNIILPRSSPRFCSLKPGGSSYKARLQ